MFQVVVVLHSGFVQVSEDLSRRDAEALAEALFADSGEFIATLDLRAVSQ